MATTFAVCWLDEAGWEPPIEDGLLVAGITSIKPFVAPHCLNTIYF